MSRSLLTRTLVLATLASSISCFNLNQGDSPLESDPYATSDTMNILEVSNGFGRLLPYVVPIADPFTGLPTAQLVEIRTFEDLLNNEPTVLNPVKPPASWPSLAINPSNQTGNHFVAVKFSRSIARNSILDQTAAGLANNGLTGAVTVVAYDQATGQSEAVKGRGFVNGQTYFGTGPSLERWVRKNGNNIVDARTVTRNGSESQPGIGFPGTSDETNGIVDGSFQGAGALISPNTFVFVVDTDENLATYESFPADRVIRIVIKGSEDGSEEGSIIGGVRSADGRFLEQGGVGTSQVSTDTTVPSPLLDGLGGVAVTSPPDLATDLPCDQEIRFSFDEACQPYSIGPLPGLVAPALSNEFTVEFLPPVAPGSPPPGSTIQLPYTVLPVSPFNFTEFVISPVVNFPGSDPFGAQSQATVTYFHNSAVDLIGNTNGSSQESTKVDFSVGAECPGLVNVPVAPGAIVAASNGGGTTGGLRVIDLDGFGQGTGDPTHDSSNPFYNVTFNTDGDPITGDVSKFPFNPNLAVPGIFPPLSADTTSLAGGSRGVFTLAQDSTLRTQLVTSSELGTVTDMLLGHPLDIAFNNYECLSGGQNLCANAAFQAHPLAGSGEGNSITAAPHPNPPRLQLAPACFSPLIQTEEPTQVGPTNLLITQGNAFGAPNVGAGPSGLLTASDFYKGVNFYGPAPTQPGCPTFTLRQQVGHFLYVLDGSGEQIVVLNSNRMTVIDRIPVSSPRNLAMAPDLDLLAVSNNGPNTVTFIDTNPNSPTFHQVVKTTGLVDTLNARNGLGPSDIVWQPDGEDILVICERSGSMAIISGSGLETRKIIPGVSNPKFLAVTDRATNFGFSSGLYYAYVISASGSMNIFESGPDGIQGIGFDDFVGSPTLDGRSGFSNPSAILMDPSSNQHGVFVAYSDAGTGLVDEIWLENAPSGPVSIRIPPGAVVDPNRREKSWKLQKQYSNFSSSAIIDLAVDDLTNQGDITQVLSAIVGGNASHSGKGMHRNGAPVSQPQFLFAANSTGLVDVLDLTTGLPVLSQPIRVPGVSILAHYWRQ